MKLFSIIVTVFNKEKTLKKCINSILNNEFNNYELIIVNDGSIDNSLKIIEDYSNKYENIRIINISHKGISYIRKNISKEIKGKYVIYIDADDSIEPDLLNKLEKTINLYNPDIIKYNINEINSKENKNRYMIKNLKYTILE